MQFEFKNKKIIEFIQGMSLKSVGISFVSSFILASAASVGIAYFIVPDDGGGSKPRFSRAELDLDEKGLSKDETKLILQRNIFNSEGSLGEEQPEIPEEELVIAGQLVKSSLPIKVLGIIFGGDPRLGLATLENTQKRKTDFYVVGDMVTDDAKLSEVYEDRVILDVNGRREYIELEPFEIVRTRRKKGSSPGRSNAFSRLATKPPPDSYQEDGFQRKSNEIIISEDFKRNLLSRESMAKILQDAKAEPNMVNGELKGFKLTRIREGSIYEKAGFQNNDVVEEINGIPLRDAAGAIRLLQQLKSARDIEVRINRGGNSFDTVIEIQ